MNLDIVFASSFPSWAIFLVVILLAAVIGVIAFAIHLIIKKRKPEEKIESEEKIAQDNVDRFVEDVSDEETKKEFEKYVKEHEEDEKKDNK